MTPGPGSIGGPKKELIGELFCISDLDFVGFKNRKLCEHVTVWDCSGVFRAPGEKAMQNLYGIAQSFLDPKGDKFCKMSKFWPVRVSQENKSLLRGLAHISFQQACLFMFEVRFIILILYLEQIYVFISIIFPNSVSPKGVLEEDSSKLVGLVAHS